MMNEQSATGRARVEVFSFKAGSGTGEYHVMIHAASPLQPFGRQLEEVETACRELQEKRLPRAVTVFRRYFLSDAANQAPLLTNRLAGRCGGACSAIGQAPLDGSKVALWAYLREGVQAKVLPDGTFEAAQGPYRHLWSIRAAHPGGNAGQQTSRLFEDYVQSLRQSGGTLEGNCLRTWLFVRDIDADYADMAAARNEVFRAQGLRPDTHFIASTGIGGHHAGPSVRVGMDAYAVTGIRPEQVRYLHAPACLNPTHEYGVSFERGTCVDFDDRRQVFISGTASIDNHGQVVHPGDIRQQTRRVWTNVEALLDEAGCDFRHVGQMIVYLRDASDYPVVKEMFDRRFPPGPRVFVHAAVCRPAWLIEMECMAVAPLTRS